VIDLTIFLDAGLRRHDKVEFLKPHSRYYEIFENIQIAIAREKRLKEWPRKWKLDLIEKNNPQWRDLYDKIYC
jgi:predicted GIY-YIG superfamily endonuclease